MELPRYHRMRRTLYHLEGSACAGCGGRFFPPRAVCPSCRKGGLAPHRFGGRGTLYSFTRVVQPPRGFASVAPYDVGMVRLEEGPLLTAQLTDTEGIDLEIGMPLEMVTRTLRDSAEHACIVYGYKFRPLVRAAAREPRPRA